MRNCANGMEFSLMGRQEFVDDCFHCVTRDTEAAAVVVLINTIVHDKSENINYL